MSSDPSHLPASVVNRHSRRRSIGPADRWSNAHRLPKEIAADVEMERWIEMLAAIPMPKTYPLEAKEARFASMLDRLRSIDPRDSSESMLAIQMLATQAFTMESFRKATECDGLSPKVQDAYLSQAMRLSSLYVRQMEALDRRRQRGQQNITVRHVQVDPGGKAIVGNVELRQCALAQGKGGAASRREDNEKENKSANRE